MENRSSAYIIIANIDLAGHSGHWNVALLTSTLTSPETFLVFLITFCTFDLLVNFCDFIQHVWRRSKRSRERRAQGGGGEHTHQHQGTFLLTLYGVSRVTGLCVSQVTTQTGEEVFFKIKRNTKLSKLQGAYATKVGKDVNSIRWVLCSFISHLCWFLYTRRIAT